MAKSSNLEILLVSAAYYPYPSGVSEHVHHLAQEMKNLGHNVTILTTNFSNFSCNETSETVVRLGRAFLIPLNKSFATLPVGINLPVAVRTFLRNNRFDIVHLHGFFPPEISFWALHYSKSINLVTFLTAGFRNYTWAQGLFRNLYKTYARKLHSKIAISKIVQTTFQEFIPGEYRVIPSGVDLNRFNPSVLPCQRGMRSKILFVGRLEKRKGLPVLLHSLPIIKKEISEVLLIIIGTGPLENFCRSLVNRLGIKENVEFKGYVHRDTLPNYYTSCDVFCSPALGGEALGIVLLEAMASKKPVVATNISGYNEVITKPNQGILVSPNNPFELAQGIIRLLKDKRLNEEIAENGFKRALDFSWQKIGQKTEELYLELLAHSKKD